MMYEMRRKKPEPTLLLTQEFFNLPHHIGMVCEELAYDDTVSLCTAGKWTGIHTFVPMVTHPAR